MEASAYADIIYFLIWIGILIAVYYVVYKKGEKLLASMFWMAISLFVALFQDTIIGLIIASLGATAFIIEFTKWVSKHIG